MIPPAVLAAYPDAVRACRWVPLPPGGGLGGGRVWRGEIDGVPLYALKRWPAGFGVSRLHLVHERMRTVSELGLAPQVLNALGGGLLVVHGGCWDVTEWTPGEAGSNCYSVSRTSSAAATLARMHSSWGNGPRTPAPIPAVRRRLDVLREWGRTRFHYTDIDFDDAATAIRENFHPAYLALKEAEVLRARLHPSHGDYWPENVLFAGDAVSAVLDFANVGLDVPEADLARFLADVPGIRRHSVRSAVAAYNANGPFDLSVPLMETLIATGRVCSLARWLMRVNACEVAAADALPRVRRLVVLLTG